MSHILTFFIVFALGNGRAEIFAGATTETMGTEQGQVASQLQGGNVSLTAGRDITTVGSDLIALTHEPSPLITLHWLVPEITLST